MWYTYSIQNIETEYKQKILTSISTKRKEVKMLVEINEKELLLMIVIVLMLKVL